MTEFGNSNLWPLDMNNVPAQAHCHKSEGKFHLNKELKLHSLKSMISVLNFPLKTYKFTWLSTDECFYPS